MYRRARLSTTVHGESTETLAGPSNFSVGPLGQQPGHVVQPAGADRLPGGSSEGDGHESRYVFIRRRSNKQLVSLAVCRGVNWWQTLIFGLFNLLVGGVVLGPLLEPGSRRMRRLGRRLWRESPVDLYVDSDQGAVGVDHPPTMSFAYYFVGGLPQEDPPPDWIDWSAWGARHGALDLGTTILRVTITARSPATVVLQPPRIRSRSRAVPAGVAVISPPPGGAALSRRRYTVDLAAGLPAWPNYEDPEASESLQPSWSLTTEDTEELYFYVRANDAYLHEWSMDLPFFFDGRRRTVSLPRNSKTFTTVGRDHEGVELWREGGTWQSACDRSS